MEIAPGSKFLRAAGMVCTIVGGLGIMSSAMGLAMSNIFGAAVGPLGNSYHIAVLVWSLFQISIGIMGTKYCGRPEKASIHKALGIADIGLIIPFTIFIVTLLGNALGVSPQDSAVFLLIGIAPGLMILVVKLPLSILYIVGAQKNLAAHRKRISTN